MNERKYIRKQKCHNKYYYQLFIPAYDTKEQIYIRSGTIEELKKLRDEIIQHNYTKQELIQNKPKWKKPRAEPLIEPYIRKNKNGKYTVTNKRSYGTYATLEEAQQIRDKLIKADWNEDKVEGIKVKRRNRLGEDRYIFKERGGKYSIKRMKIVNGKVKTTRFEGSIPTLEEARVLRDEWEAIDWDWNKIDLI